MRDLTTASLQSVADYLRSGEITDAQADEYLSRWNANPSRFTFAERCGASISQVPRCGDCGEIRRNHDASHRFAS